MMPEIHVREPTRLQQLSTTLKKLLNCCSSAQSHFAFFKVMFVHDIIIVYVVHESQASPQCSWVGGKNTKIKANLEGP